MRIVKIETSLSFLLHDFLSFAVDTEIGIHGHGFIGLPAGHACDVSVCSGFSEGPREII
jgi:hypothetical protein